MLSSKGIFLKSAFKSGALLGRVASTYLSIRPILAGLSVSAGTKLPVVPTTRLYTIKTSMIEFLSKYRERERETSLAY